MGANGDAGNSITTILGDCATIVGDHANVLPSQWTEPTGEPTKEYSLSGSGMIDIDSAIPTYRGLDNGADFHGGNYTITALNGIHFEAASGGLSADISGNIALSSWGGKTNITSTTEVGVLARVIQINATNVTKIGGKNLYVDANQTTFAKNVTFGNNVKINGGLAVNGELYASHITCLKQTQVTAITDTLKGYPISGSMLYGEVIVGDPLTIGPIIIRIQGEMAIPIVAVPPHYHLYDSIAMTGVEGLSDLMSAAQNVESDSPAKASSPTLEALKSIGKKVAKAFEKYITTTLGIPMK